MIPLSELCYPHVNIERENGGYHMKQSLYREKPICKDCMRAKVIPFREEFLCEKKGVVTADYCCKHFSLNINAKKNPRVHLYDVGRFKTEDFSLEN